MSQQIDQDKFILFRTGKYSSYQIGRVNRVNANSLLLRDSRNTVFEVNNVNVVLVSKIPLGTIVSHRSSGPNVVYSVMEEWTPASAPQIPLLLNGVRMLLPCVGVIVKRDALDILLKTSVAVQYTSFIEASSYNSIALRKQTNTVHPTYSLGASKETEHVRVIESTVSPASTKRHKKRSQRYQSLRNVRVDIKKRVKAKKLNIKISNTDCESCPVCYVKWKEGLSIFKYDCCHQLICEDCIYHAHVYSTACVFCKHEVVYHE